MKQEDSVAKILAQRTLFYCVKVGLQFLGAAILISLFSSFSEWSQTQQWVWNSKSFLWVVKGGIMITPFASFFYALNECADKYKWKTRLFFTLLFIAAVLFFSTIVYIRKYTNWM